MSSLEETLTRLFRVPAEPDPPTGEPDELRVFRASRGYLHYRLLSWALRQSWAVGVVLVYFWIEWRYGFVNFIAGFSGNAGWIGLAPEFVWPLVTVAETFAIVFLLIQIPVTFFMTHLDYRLRWYMTTDRSLRIREGLSRVREQTMMFSNVQNVAIRQGPLQRFFGISDVEVRSAGGGGKSSNEKQKQWEQKDDLHVCYFRGVSNAPEIRDLILSHLRRVRGAGLGNPEDDSAAVPDDSAASAGRLLLDEAKALRRVLS